MNLELIALRLIRLPVPLPLPVPLSASGPMSPTDPFDVLANRACPKLFLS